MEDVYKMETIQRYNNICGFKTMHPLVAYVESNENNCKFIPGTVQEYIAVRLFSYAKRQLSSPVLSVKDVTASQGFLYPQHFVRFFKKHSGMTPECVPPSTILMNI